jgi:cobalt-zinc-cadmium efflux system membrane fusion protein
MKRNQFAAGYPATWLLFLLVALGVGGCQSKPDPKSSLKPPEDEVWLSDDELSKALVQVAPIEEREVDTTLTIGGRIAFDDVRVSHVFSPVVGRVTRVLAQPGERLKKGAPLLAMLSPDIGSIVSDLVKAQADLSALERDFLRQQTLAAAHAGTQRELESAEDAYRKAQAEFERARKKQELLKAGSLDTVTQEFTLRSQIEGEVISRTVNPGMEVQGQYSGGNALELFTIGELDQVWVLADVSDQDFPRVQKGAEVSVRVIAYPDREFKGTLDWVSSTLDPTLRTAKVRCSLRNPDRALKVEMYSTLKVSVPGRKALAIPRDAVVRIGDQTLTFVAAGKTPDGRSIFKRRRIRVFDHDEPFLAVMDGLTAGESVVIQGAVSSEPSNDEAWITTKQLEAASVRLAVAREQDVDINISVGGKITFDDLKVTHIFSPVTGRVTRVLGQLGQSVSKGTPLAAIASPDVGTTASDVLKAKAGLTTAEHEYRRQQELYAAHATSQKDFETAEGTYRKAKAEYERAQLKSQLLKSGVIDQVTQEYTIRSPIAGEIVARGANPGIEVQGQYSGANNPLELFTIGDLNPIWVVGDVYEMDLSRIKPGASVAVKSPLFPDQEFRGKVDWIANALDPILRTAKVRCTLANPNKKLKPEMYQIVTISVPGKAVLAIPRSAVLRLGDETVVFAAAGQRPDGKIVFKRRRVTVNEEETGNLIPVLDGLKAGDTIVVEGAIFLAGLV